MVSYFRKLPSQQVVTEVSSKGYDGKEFATSCWIFCLRLQKCFGSVTIGFPYHPVLEGKQLLWQTDLHQFTE